MHGDEWIGVVQASLQAAMLRLESASVSIYGQLQDWNDRTDWDSLRPWIYAGVTVWCMACLALYVLLFVDERDTEIWAALSPTGRWIASGVVVATAVLWVGSSATGLI
jgi:hypothetical protein